MSKPNILIQLDVDAQASVFDAVVAADADVDHLFRHHGVQPGEVRDLVHGAMFTRGPRDLQHTGIFVGGSDVRAAEQILTEVIASFFGPMRVSVLFDASGSNTTAAAAVLKAEQHVPLESSQVAVLGATGPVGQRAVQMLAGAGASVRVASRRLERARDTCSTIGARHPQAALTPCATGTTGELIDALNGCKVVIAAGAAGFQLVTSDVWHKLPELQVAIDLNAVPPAGIAPIEPTDAGIQRDHAICYGPIGIGGLKMKIHKAAIRALFSANDRVLEAQEIFQLGQSLVS